MPCQTRRIAQILWKIGGFRQESGQIKTEELPNYQAFS
jgi:hypothetical protein